MFQCSADCCGSKSDSTEQVANCVEGCSTEFRKAQTYIGNELTGLQVGDLSASCGLLSWHSQTFPCFDVRLTHFVLVMFVLLFVGPSRAVCFVMPGLDSWPNDSWHYWPANEKVWRTIWAVCGKVCRWHEQCTAQYVCQDERHHFQKRLPQSLTRTGDFVSS